MFHSYKVCESLKIIWVEEGQTELLVKYYPRLQTYIELGLGLLPAMPPPIERRGKRKSVPAIQIRMETTAALTVAR